MTRAGLVTLIAATLERARRSQVSDNDDAVADMILRDLRAAGVTLRGPAKDKEPGH